MVARLFPELPEPGRSPGRRGQPNLPRRIEGIDQGQNAHLLTTTLQLPGDFRRNDPAEADASEAIRPGRIAPKKKLYALSRELLDGRRGLHLENVEDPHGLAQGQRGRQPRQAKKRAIVARNA